MSELPVDRQAMEVDIACVGFGPAAGGFLTALSRGLLNPDGTPRLESAVMPGMPLQVVCYERADDIGFGVSGVVTRARGIRQSFPDLDLSQIPLAVPVAHETVDDRDHGVTHERGFAALDELHERGIGLGHHAASSTALITALGTFSALASAKQRRTSLSINAVAKP